MTSRVPHTTHEMLAADCILNLNWIEHFFEFAKHDEVMFLR